jgi:hypothetical protein
MGRVETVRFVHHDHICANCASNFVSVYIDMLVVYIVIMVIYVCPP